MFEARSRFGIDLIFEGAERTRTSKTEWRTDSRRKGDTYHQS